MYRILFFSALIVLMGIFSAGRSPAYATQAEVGNDVLEGQIHIYEKTNSFLNSVLNLYLEDNPTQIEEIYNFIHDNHINVVFDITASLALGQIISAPAAGEGNADFNKGRHLVTFVDYRPKYTALKEVDYKKIKSPKAASLKVSFDGDYISEIDMIYDKKNRIEFGEYQQERIKLLLEKKAEFDFLVKLLKSEAFEIKVDYIYLSLCALNDGQNVKGADCKAISPQFDRKFRKSTYNIYSEKCEDITKLWSCFRFSNHMATSTQSSPVHDYIDHINSGGFELTFPEFVFNTPRYWSYFTLAFYSHIDSPGLIFASLPPLDSGFYAGGR